MKPNLIQLKKLITDAEAALEFAEDYLDQRADSDCQGDPPRYVPNEPMRRFDEVHGARSWLQQALKLVDALAEPVKTIENPQREDLVNKLHRHVTEAEASAAEGLWATAVADYREAERALRDLEALDHDIANKLEPKKPSTPLEEVLCPSCIERLKNNRNVLAVVLPNIAIA